MNGYGFVERRTLRNETAGRNGDPAATGFVLALMLVATGPVLAQMDFAGEWRNTGQQDVRDNPHIGEIVGLPLSEESIHRAETYDQSILSFPEWQCRPHSAAYVKRDPSNLRISRITDPANRNLIGYEMEWYRNVTVPIYMDGRSHPPEMAPHSWLGFSTATWEGEKLRITTTHMKENWYRRNGPPQSDASMLTEYVMRRQFRGWDYLTWVIIAYDDHYLTEPLIRSTEYQDALNQQMTVYPCTPVTEVVWAEGYVPHFLPGQNEHFTNFSVAYGLPLDVMYDGAQTMYPEYRLKLGEFAKSTSRTLEASSAEYARSRR